MSAPAPAVVCCGVALRAAVVMYSGVAEARGAARREFVCATCSTRYVLRAVATAPPAEGRAAVVLSE